MVGDSYIDGLAAQRADVGARFVAFRANLADLEARGVNTWAATQALAEVPPLLLAASQPEPQTLSQAPCRNRILGSRPPGC